MDEGENSIINQGGHKNLNIVNNSGPVYLNTKTECNLSLEEISKNFIEASEDLSSHKSYFGKNRNLYIKRKEVNDIEEWILKDLNPREGPIAVLAGNAGYGKSVTAKQLLNSLSDKKIPVLALKSDKLTVESVGELNSELGLKLGIEELIKSLCNKSERIVVIIDQIDALSQSLSSNRKPLNIYNRLIGRISKISPNVRLVISCRMYDLEYDPYLQQYDNLKKIVLEKLDDKETEHILKALGIKSETLSKEFKEFLRIPIHLEIFSIICSAYKLLEFRSLQELYAEYWRQKILNASVGSKVLNFVKELSDEMFQSQQITKDRRFFEDKYSFEIRYLISEGVITEGGNKIQFVHQSFFDYTTARCFVDDNRSVAGEILLGNKHQGLFIRSGLKHVLFYLREVKYKVYLEELKMLLFSSNLRFHLKLLIINNLGFLNTPREEEKAIIKSLKEKDGLLFKLFIESAAEESWLRFLLEDLKISDLLASKSKEYRNYVFQVLRKTLADNSDLAIKYIRKLPDFEEKGNFISRLLFFTEDFSNAKILNLFDEYHNPNDIHGYFHFLENALKPYPDWVITKLQFFFENTKPDTLGHPFSKHYEERHTYEALLKEQPGKAIKYFVELLLSIGLRDRTALLEAGIDGYYSGHQFMFYSPQKKDNSTRELLFFICDSVMNYLESQYSIQTEQIKDFISRFTSTKSLILHSLVIPTLIKYKQELADCIVLYLIERPELFTEFEHCSVFEYYFRELLKEAYPVFSEEQKEIINGFILRAIPVAEKTRSYRFRKGITQHGMLWHGLTMFKLLSMIPEENRKEFQAIDTKYKELERKFNVVKNEKPTGIVVTSGETIMNGNAYEYMTFEHWKQTFREYKGDDSPPWDNKVSELGHSRKFEELCSTKPQKFYPLIEEIIEDKTIFISYVVYGLEGLTKSNFSPTKIANIFQNFIHSRSDELSGFPLQMTVWMTDYFIKNELIMDTVVTFLCDVIINQPDKNPLNNDLVTDGINSPRGAAVDRLVRCYKFKDFEDKIFKTLETIAHSSNSVTRAATLCNLALLNNLDAKRNLDLFLKLVDDYNPGLLKIPLHNLHPLLYLIHVDFEKLIPFFEKAIEIEDSHKVISHILFFAWLNDYPKSKDLLDQILYRNEAARATVVKIAFANLKVDKSFNKCHQIILQYLDQDEKEIADEYEHAFYQLKPRLFKNIEEFLFLYVNSNVGKRRGYAFYKYLQKCIRKYQNREIAEKCIELTKEFRNHLGPDITERSLTNEPLQVIIDSYSVIRDYHEQTEALELAMDVFDEILKMPEYRSDIRSMLNELDESIL